MPVFEYKCIECELIFEELFVSKIESEKHFHEYVCPKCESVSYRIMSVTNFVFKSDTPGNSGSHDLDYPALDKAVGRSANKKWKKINQDREIKAKVRRETGSNFLTKTADGNYEPISKKALKVRDMALHQLKKVKNSSE